MLQIKNIPDAVSAAPGLIKISIRREDEEGIMKNMHCFLPITGILHLVLRPKSLVIQPTIGQKELYVFAPDQWLSIHRAIGKAYGAKTLTEGEQ